MRILSNVRTTRSVSLAAWMVSVALVAACNSSPPKPDPEKMLEMHREQALGYYEAGALPQAEDQIRKGLDIAPKDDQLKLMLGWVRQRRGGRDDLNVAEKVFRDLAPRKDYRALLGLAECLERKGVLYVESAQKISEGKHQTDAADPQKRAQELNLEAEKFWNEALTHYQEVLTLRPTEGQAMNGMQRTCTLLGRLEDSLSWAEKLLAQSASEIVFWEKQLKRTDLRAEEEAQMRGRLVDTRELCVATHNSAATQLVRLGRKSEAIAHLDSALLLAPDMSAIYSRRGQLLFELGRFEEASANLDEFMRLSSLPFDDPAIQRALATQAEAKRKLAALNASAK
ncbi:MAG TPA: tetratricopeptide repeat protein [Planctomycetota bacterium]|nr:tetratricopeptide repeat protein [Planctomycetota bacterium]